MRALKRDCVGAPVRERKDPPIARHVCHCSVRECDDALSEWLTEELTSEEVTIERVRIDREVDSIPPVREQDGAVVIPVVEQRLVIEKRWVLKEELHVRKTHRTEPIDVPVTVRASEVAVERDRAPDPGADSQ